MDLEFHLAVAGSRRPGKQSRRSSSGSIQNGVGVVTAKVKYLRLRCYRSLCLVAPSLLNDLFARLFQDGHGKLIVCCWSFEEQLDRLQPFFRAVDTGHRSSHTILAVCEHRIGKRPLLEGTICPQFFQQDDSLVTIPVNFPNSVNVDSGYRMDRPTDPTGEPVLLQADANGPAWTDQQIADAYRCRRQTVENLRETLKKTA